jgi:hypothetical protein
MHRRIVSTVWRSPAAAWVMWNAQQQQQQPWSASHCSITVTSARQAPLPAGTTSG